MSNLAKWCAACAALAVLFHPVALLSAAQPSPADKTVPATEQPPSPAAEPRLAATVDVSYIPAEATVAIVVHPRPLWTGPDAEWMPLEVIRAAGMQQFGVDPVQIREAIACVIPPPAAEPNAEPTVGVVIRFVQPYSKASLLAKLIEPKEVEAEGKTFYQLNNPTRSCFFLPDDRTIVFAPRPMLHSMLAAKDVRSPLVKLLRETDCSATYTAIASLDAMRDLITGALVKMPALPPPLDQFRKAPTLISSAKMQLNLAAGADFRLTLHAVDDEAATELFELANNGLAMGRQLVLSQILQGMRNNSDDPVQQATVKYATRIVNQLFERVKPVREGRNVRLALHTESGTAVLGVAVSLLLPAVQAARAAARRTQSSNNLHQISLAMLLYEQNYARFPARAIFDKNGKPLLSWRVQILPNLDQEALYKEFHLDEAWDSEHNKPLIAKMPRVYANPYRQVDGKTTYLVPVGPGTVFEGDKGLKISQITDGASNTILTLEANEDRAVIWTKPDDLTVDMAKPAAGLDKLPAGCFNAAFCDGSVRCFSSFIDAQTLKALFTYAGGEVVHLP